MKTQKTYKYIIFDFDGTINNTSPGIYETFTAVLDHFGVDATKVDLSRHIGPPLNDSYTRLLGEKLCADAVELHKQVFEQIHAERKSFLYDGIKEVLGKLKDSGRYVLSIASSKYEPHVAESLEYHGLTEFFDCAYGQTERRGFKKEVLRQLIEDHGWDKSLCLLIGDTLHDIEGAKCCGIDSVAVTYGFGRMDELADSHPIALVSSPKEILELLLPNETN